MMIRINGFRSIGQSLSFVQVLGPICSDFVYGGKDEPVNGPRVQVLQGIEEMRLDVDDGISFQQFGLLETSLFTYEEANVAFLELVRLHLGKS